MVNPKLRDEQNDMLFEAILSLKSLEECYQFFEDICTISELKALSQRLAVARMLQGGISMMISWPAPVPARLPSAG